MAINRSQSCLYFFYTTSAETIAIISLQSTTINNSVISFHINAMHKKHTFKLRL